MSCFTYKPCTTTTIMSTYWKANKWWHYRNANVWYTNAVKKESHNRVEWPKIHVSDYIVVYRQNRMYSIGLTAPNCRPGHALFDMPVPTKPSQLRWTCKGQNTYVFMSHTHATGCSDFDFFSFATFSVETTRWNTPWQLMADTSTHFGNNHILNL